jgi:STAM-binding protein
MPTFRSRAGCALRAACGRRSVRPRHQSWRNSSPIQAEVYEAEGNDPQTYLLLYRHANLVLDHLQNHPEKSKPENKKALGAATVAVSLDLKKLEQIRPRIKKRHAEYQERKKALKALEGRDATLPRDLDGLGVEPRQAGRNRASFARQTLDAEGNQSLAAKLAQREVKRRDAARRGVRQAGVSEEEEQERRTAGVWGDWETDLKRQSREGDDDIQSQLQEVSRLQQNGHKAPNFSVCTCLWL